MSEVFDYIALHACVVRVCCVCGVYVDCARGGVRKLHRAAFLRTHRRWQGKWLVAQVSQRLQRNYLKSQYIRRSSRVHAHTHTCSKQWSHWELSFNLHRRHPARATTRHCSGFAHLYPERRRALCPAPRPYPAFRVPPSPWIAQSLLHEGCARLASPSQDASDTRLN